MTAGAALTASYILQSLSDEAGREEEIDLSQELLSNAQLVCSVILLFPDWEILV